MAIARLGRALALALLAGSAIVAAPLMAQDRRGETAKVAPPTLVLTGNIRGVRSDATTGRLLDIEVLDLAVRVRGGVAETRITATFRNPTSDVLEGDFAFDMPAGSVITGYALDVGPDMIDGVIAGRDRAREAYQRRVVQRIDPGLAEVTWADRFSTRIFPIPARGSRTIRLVMTSPLDPVAGYVLPMRPAGAVGRLTLRIESDDGTPPAAVLPSGLSGSWTDGRLSADQWNVRIGGELRLPPVAPREGLTVSRHANGEQFFDLVRRIDAAPPVAAPRRVHIFWDRSISRADDELAEEAALLADLLRDGRTMLSALTLFDSGGAETTRPDSAATLARALTGVRYQGATSFAVLSDVAVEAGAECIVVSDGRVTIDSRAGFALPCRTFTIASDREVDRGWLGHVAERSGGAFIALGSTTRAAALALLARRSQAIGRVTAADGSIIDAVAMPAPEGFVRLVGPMPDAGSLRLIRANGQAETLARPSVVAPLFSGPGALWASRRIAADSNEMRTADLVALSRRYSVASPLASFIVLEQPADYVEANIPPPQSYPKALQDQYAAMRASADQQITMRQAGRLNEVVALWDAQRAWWGQKFEPLAPNDPRRRTPGPVVQTPVIIEDRSDNSLLPPPPPPPPPAPPPTVVSPENRSERGEDIVVTGAMVSRSNLESATSVTVVGGEQRIAAADQDGDSAAQAEGVPGDGGTAERSDRVVDAIQKAEWSPGRPWISAIDAAGANWAEEVERQKARHGALPLFWFDLAEWHWRAGRAAEARRAVATALDLPVRDNQTLEIVAGRLMRYGELDRALALLTQLADREDERPQPVRAQAMVLMARAEAHRAAGRTDAARADLERAIALFADSVLTVRREQFRGFETVTLMDANLAVQRFRAVGGRTHALPSRLVAMFDSDIRVVVDWNTPRTDLDLWIAQPDGERVGFSNILSAAGGKLSGDVTNGFGPEEYLIRVAPRGSYTIEIDTFASDRTNPNGPSTVQARIIRNFGRPNQSEELVDVEMDPTDDGMRRVGTIAVR
jgi:tetratricopeptide (TPR) repeat protein